MHDKYYDYGDNFVGRFVDHGREEGEMVGRAKGLAEGKAIGEIRGEARGLASAIITVLRAKRVPVPETSRQRITSCTDFLQLDTWLKRAVHAGSVGVLFEERPTAFRESAFD